MHTHVEELKDFQMFREKPLTTDRRQDPTTTVVSMGIPALSGTRILTITPEIVSRQYYIFEGISLYDPAEKKRKGANVSVRKDGNQQHTNRPIKIIGDIMTFRP